MAILLEKIGLSILCIAGIGFCFYLRYLSAMDVEQRRVRRSGIQGLFKKVD
jgi:hypothetical protein